ncbi:uncharacterized protein I303_100897 [Kwoniella dejecticola CBS 10117]|uniref:Uncharacterized protein n=1 Tax=Kwoniella dejecticola CBS 10117 TaxID=1296121 RepID=A0A1A6AG90_9TREE|nr:uncharacterized protein I303_00901 [Kwoniella dejecticola CBS 10117]OBR89079.1 hypothetical protein I303_00901 [Kwoniella dejecticola CBS 10117]
MDEDFQPNRGMLACFPCMILWRWGRNKVSSSDPELEPLFPSPHTVLTPPVKKARPNLPNISSPGSVPLWSSEPTSPTKSGLGSGLFGENKRNGSSSRLSDEGRERLGSISRAYGGRMQPLHPPSLPSTPSLPCTPYTGRHALRPLSSLNPMTTTMTSASTESTSPNRPSAPNLGRSASEPRNLSELGFAPHQIPRFGSISVGRGGRKRSLTVSDRSPLGLDLEEGEETGGRRGRSPGPALFSRLNDTNADCADTIPDVNVARTGYGAVDDKRPMDRPLGRSSSHPHLETNTPASDQSDESGLPETDHGQNQGVVRRELGLRGLSSIRGGKRGRRNGIGGKRIRSD